MATAQATLQYNKIIYAAGVENERRKRAYEAGKDAKRKGYSRTSPYYEKPVLDQFFFGGYDGLTLEQTVLRVHKFEASPSLKLSDFVGQQLAHVESMKSRNTHSQ